MGKLTKKKKEKIANGILYSVLAVIVLSVVGLVIYAVNGGGNLKFDDSEWQYMYSYIEKEFGNGEKFHIVSTDTDLIQELVKQRADDDGVVRDYYRTLGIKASIVGYFDSQENMYSIGFSKFLEDSKIYKDGKAGTIICTAVSNNYSKENYLKDNDK